jgi:prephenate dehydrogenase
VPPTQPSSTGIAWRRVVIVGTGLIGGSWGLALDAAGFRGVRVGVDRPAVLARAVQRRAIDEAEENLDVAIRGADLIVLALPVADVSARIEPIARRAEPSVLVTDVSSVKTEICGRAAQSFTGRALFLADIHWPARRRQASTRRTRRCSPVPRTR